jgi:DNA polymerase-3 subunit gamma/tau
LTSANIVIMGSAAPAVAELSPAPDSQPVERREIKVEVRAEARPEVNAESLRDVVLHALGNQQMLVSLLENAEWSLNGNALIAKVAASGTMIEMSFPADARRIAAAAASGLAGRPIKMQIEPGGAPQVVSPARRSSSNGSARSRAEQDPIVQRMKEKFGAEIRTVIDYREKG